MILTGFKGDIVESVRCEISLLQRGYLDESNCMLRLRSEAYMRLEALEYFQKHYPGKTEIVAFLISQIESLLVRMQNEKCDYVPVTTTTTTIEPVTTTTTIPVPTTTTTTSSSTTTTTTTTIILDYIVNFDDHVCEEIDSEFKINFQDYVCEVSDGDWVINFENHVCEEEPVVSDYIVNFEGHVCEEIVTVSDYMVNFEGHVCEEEPAATTTTTVIPYDTYQVRLSTLLLNHCNAPITTVYVQQGDLIATGTYLFTDNTFQSVVTGYSYVSRAIGSQEIFRLGTTNGLIGTSTSEFCDAPTTTTTTTSAGSTTTTTTICVSEPIFLKYSDVDCDDACSTIFVMSMYADRESLSASFALYSDQFCTLADTGYYSDGEVCRYWDKDTATLGIESVCPTTTTTTLPPTTTTTTTADCGAIDMEEIIVYSPDGFAEACGSGSIFFPIADSTHLATATKLYKNYSCGLADESYYSNGIISRYWNGTQFVGVAESCPTTTTTTLPPTTTTTTTCASSSINLKYNNESCTNACANPFVTSMYADSSNFAAASKLYSDTNCTFANTGYYSDGSICRYWNASNGTLGSQSTCPTTTTTTAAPTTTTTTIPPACDAVGMWEFVVYSTVGCTEACNSGTGFIGIADSHYLATATKLYQDYSCTPADAAYYSNGDICRYWDGSTLYAADSCPTPPTTTSTTTAAPPPTTTTTTTAAPTTTTTTATPTTTTTTTSCTANSYGSVGAFIDDASVACSQTFTTSLWGNTSAFADATILYQDSGCTLASAAFYSNGTVWKQWNGTSVVGSGNCADLTTTTTTTVAPTTTTTTKAPVTTTTTTCATLNSVFVEYAATSGGVCAGGTIDTIYSATQVSLVDGQTYYSDECGTTLMQSSDYYKDSFSGVYGRFTDGVFSQEGTC